MHAGVLTKEIRYTSASEIQTDWARSTDGENGNEDISVSLPCSCVQPALAQKASGLAGRLGAYAYAYARSRQKSANVRLSLA